jgi:1-acyl-sn-glycerol-3-phosphate acyltransferase
VIRTLFTLLVAVLVTPPLALLTALVPVLRLKPGTYEWITRSWFGSLLWATGVPVRAEGLDRLPLDRPVIVASNHQSWFDVASIAHVLPRRYHFVAKKELERVPLWGRAWKQCGHISIDRSDTHAAIQSLEKAAEIVRGTNGVIIIFPEGTRSADGELLPFKKGAFRLATGIGVDIVPVAVIGSREALPRNGWRIRKQPITVRFGQPIPAAEYGPARTTELIGRVREAINGLRHAPAHSTEEDNARNHEHSRA